MHQLCFECLQVLFPLLFLTHTVCLRHLWDCKALCLIMSFLVLRFICWSSLVHFNKSPEYFTKDAAQVFIPLMKFLQYDLVFSFFRGILLYLFFHLRMFNGFRFQHSQRFVGFPFSERSDFFLI